MSEESPPYVVSSAAPGSALVLASASPRRTQLLDELGVAHVVRPADIDETPRLGEPALNYVRRMAATKAAAGVVMAAGAKATTAEPATSAPAAVLAADTIVVADGKILGKPRDRSDGLSMLARLSGRTHQVVTAVCLRDGVRQSSACVMTRVGFRSVSVQEAEGYWDTGEPKDKAGGYGIQGAAAKYVSKIDGSYSSVIGLPLTETRALLSSLGLVVRLQ